MIVGLVMIIGFVMIMGFVSCIVTSVLHHYRRWGSETSNENMFIFIKLVAYLPNGWASGEQALAFLWPSFPARSYYSRSGRDTSNAESIPDKADQGLNADQGKFGLLE